MSRVVLGNRHATDSLDDGATREALPRAKRATVIDIADGTPIDQAFLGIVSPGGIWDTHATPGKTPAWVASDDPSLATLVAAHYGGIEIRDLEEPA